MTKSGFNLERGNKEENEHIPIEKLKKITNYEMQEISKINNHMEQEKDTNDIEIIRQDYRQVINKCNIMTNKYTKVQNIIENTINKAEQIQLKNYELQQENYRLYQENKNLKEEVRNLKHYIDKTFEYVSLLFDFSKNRLKQLVNSFVDYFTNKNERG